VLINSYLFHRVDMIIFFVTESKFIKSNFITVVIILYTVHVSVVDC